MRMPLFRSHPMSALASTLCLAFATLLTGCASKNPLMEEPVASTNAAKPAEPAATVRQAQEKPAEVQPQQTKTIAENVKMTPPTGLRKFLGIFSPYRIDVQQGNFISREMVAQLKEGMQQSEGVSREQVRFVLGTPLLTDIFHADRWDYLFRLKKSSGEIISSHVTVFFDNNKLTRIDGGELPTEQEYLALIAGSTPGAKAPETGK